MKIMFNRPVKREPWGGRSHFITGLYEYLSKRGYEVVFSLQPKLSGIFMFDPRPSSGGDCVNSIFQYKLSNPECKVIQRINDTDKARPNDRPWRDKLLIDSNKIADNTIFISEWLKSYYIEKGFNNLKRNKVIVNGCNSKWYHPGLPKKLDINNIKLITHHWSDNYMKGFDVYNFIDRSIPDMKNFSFTYMGRYNKETRLIEPTYGPAVGDILRSSDIYITGARWEACGMHHVEAASCGLPVLYHKDGGGVSEVCKNHGIEFSSLSNFRTALNKIIEQYDDICSRIDYKYLSANRCFKMYEKEILSTFQ